MTVRLLAVLLLLAPIGAAHGQARDAVRPSSPIAQVLRDEDGDRVPDAEGDLATVEGIVTTDGNAFGPTGPTFYVQDGSGGLAVSLLAGDQTEVGVGDRVRVSGRLRFGRGMAVLGEARIDARSPDAERPSPVPYDASDPERVEGQLVEVEGIVVGESHVGAGTALSVTLDDHSLLVAFLYADAKAPADIEGYAPGDRIRIVGVAGQYDRSAPYDGSYQIYPRSGADLRHAGISAAMYRRGAVAVLVLLLGAIGWGVLLQRQVRRRVAQLRISEDRYRKILDLASDAIAIHDLDGRRIEMNRAGREALGREEAGPEPSFLSSVAPEDLAAARAHLARLREHGHSSTELRLTHPEGVRLYEINSQVVTLDGQPRVLSIGRDASERHAYEQGLIEAREQAEETARVKSSFLASMSHEIRTPLTAVIGFAELLRYEVADDQLDLVLAIEAGGTRLLNTLNSVLDLAQMDAGGQVIRPQPVDLVEHVDRSLDVLRPMAEGQGLTLTYATELAALPASIDPGAFDRILTNLVGNAIKFTDEGGVTVSLDAREGAFVVTVADTGIGIDAAFLPDLFNEFRQESEGHGRSHEGSGLGLAITLRLVELMEGTIEAASEKGVGTTFTVTLPHVAPAPQGEAGAFLVTADRQPVAPSGGDPTHAESVGLAELLGDG